MAIQQSGFAAVRLCGFAASNYYNKAKLALLEKGIEFSEETVYPYRNAATLQRTPMGKIPFLEVDGAQFSESQVIIEYLEDAFPTPPLYPRDAIERAKCRELLQVLELYIELQARRLYGEAFFGGKASEEIKREVGILLPRGVQALGRLARFAPYIAGAEFSYADCAAVFHLPVAASAAKKVLGIDLFAELAGYKDYIALVQARPVMERIRAERDANMVEFMQFRAAVERGKAATP